MTKVEIAWKYRDVNVVFDKKKEKKETKRHYNPLPAAHPHARSETQHSTTKIKTLYYPHSTPPHQHTHMVKETGSKLDKKNSKVSSPKRLISLTLTVYNPIQFIIVLKDSSPITPLSPLGTCKSLSVYPCNLHTLYPYHIHV